jgi:glycosyltransferase involved in cell wall biosynthesis
MAKAAPRISIIMPTYNWASVLPYSIGSVRLQTLSDFELLVVGDGCTDHSAEIVAAIGDDRLRWIGLDENSGHQSTPTNAGLRAARGEIIAYLGHDDLWLPDHLASLARAIDDGADLAYAATRWISPDRMDGPVSALRQYRPGLFMPPSSVAHRRAVVDAIGGWRDYRALDEFPEVDMWRRAHAAGFRFAFVPRLTVIKFPAGKRPNVYRERPCHEQAEWLERIRREPNLASAELIALVCDRPPPHLMRYRQLAGHFWNETWRRIGARLARLGAHASARPAPGAMVDELRRIKGLEPAGRDRFGQPPEPVAAARGDPA